MGLPDEQPRERDSCREDENRDEGESHFYWPHLASLRPERNPAYAAHYVMQRQVAASYPEMADMIKELGLPSGTGIWTYIQEHHLEIAGVLHATVKACGDYVALFDGFISHFEKPAP